MDVITKNKMIKVMQEQIVQRKAMFIPMFCVSAFALVGYAAADRQAPTIKSNKIQVLYGSSLKASDFEITDNRDSSDALKVKIDDASYDAKQLGTYTVNVTATDLFSNTTTKSVQVEVVDNQAPTLTSKSGNGYVVDVEANGSNDVSKYLKATDNVDGDVTDFIETDDKLDTSKIGTQTISVNVADDAGNVTKKTYEFYVSDSKAPTISLKKGKTVTVDYGSKFDISKYVKTTDSYDGSDVDLNVDGNVDTTDNNSKTTLNLTATDSSDNTSESSLTVKVADISAPDIDLKKSKVKIKKGSSISLKNYIESATDNKDGNVKSDVKISGKVNTKKSGTYTISYSVKDEAGNEETDTLKVTVYTPSSNSGDDLDSNSGIAGTALTRKGCSYVLGGNGPTIFDCSGLARWAYAKHGISLPRTAAAQYAATSRVSKSQLKAGDLVFFAGTTGRSGITHVGIYIGGGMMVHAAGHSSGVIVSSIYSSYFVSHYAGAGRK